MANRSQPHVVLLTILGTLAACAHIPMGGSQPITVLAQERTTIVEDAVLEGDHLWVPEESLPIVNGFRLEPEGLCAGDLCIPLARDGSWTRRNGSRTYVDVTAVAEHLHQEWISDEAGTVWSFAPVPALTSTNWELGQAPDFTLPDMDGRPVRLSEFRGKKVLLLTWASW